MNQGPKSEAHGFVMAMAMLRGEVDDFRQKKLDKTANQLEVLIAKLGRWERGEFTEDEIHNICHNLPRTVSLETFANGCHAEQKKLYGCSWKENLIAEIEKLPPPEGKVHGIGFQTAKHQVITLIRRS